MKRKTNQWLKDHYQQPYMSAENILMAAALVCAEQKLRERQHIAELMQAKDKDTKALVSQNSRIRTAINTLESLIGSY